MDDHPSFIHPASRIQASFQAASIDLISIDKIKQWREPATSRIWE
jgi:hypothetical protein